MMFDDNLLLELILRPHIPPSPKCVTHQTLMTLIHRIHPNRKQKAHPPSPSYHPLGDPPAMTIMTELILLGPAPCDLHEAFVLRAEGTSIFGDKNRKFSLAYCIVCLLMYQTARCHGRLYQNFINFGKCFKIVGEGRGLQCWGLFENS